MLNENENDKILEKVDEKRRGFLKSVLGTGFAVPVIASFSVATLLTSTANATPHDLGNPDLFNSFFTESGR
jgi:hypothetical protein